ncbi:MAG TPA: hypothetical protein VH583_12555 [Vicinamibacterales bacterium]|jgi:hypothetical protein
MIERLALIVVAALSSIAEVQQPVQFADARAEELVRRVQAAIAQGRPLSDLHALSMQGRVRVPDDTGSPVDSMVEIKILLPDRYLRRETSDGSERRSGFAGGTLLTAGGDLRVERLKLARLMLGMAASFVGDKVTARVSTDEAFADTAAIDVTGPSLAGRLVVDLPSYLPLRVVSSGDLRRGSTVVSFSNRRTVGGFDLPFRITTQTSERVLETLMFDDILVNPTLRDSDFRK